MSKRLVSKTEWAKEQGFSPAYVSKLLKKGRIVAVDGKIDANDAELRLSATASPMQAAAKTISAEMAEDFSEQHVHRYGKLSRNDVTEALIRARLKRELEEGKIKELERKKREGVLVIADEFEQAYRKRLAEEREALLNWPRRIAANLAADLGVQERPLLQDLERLVRAFLAERSSRAANR